jgi:excisionase family DNA binding protein
MAGRFLSLEEAAQQLGVSVDDVHRLVDRKKLYPIRDGSGLKFKADDLDRYLVEQQEEAGTSDDLVALPEAAEAAPLEIDADAEDSLTLDVEAMIELEPASVIEAEPASVVAVDEPPSAITFADESAGAGQTSDVELALDLDDPRDGDVEVAQATPAPVVRGEQAESDSIVLLEPDDATSAISGLSAPVIKDNAAESSGEELLLADSGRLSLDRDDLELGSIIAASAQSLPAADEPGEAGTLSIDLGEPILGDPLAASGPGNSAASLAVGDDDDLVVGSNAGRGKMGSALSDVLDSGVLIEEKAVELEGIQTWDEVDLGIEEEEQGADADVGTLDGEFGGQLNDENFSLGDTGDGGDGGSINIPAEPSEASDLFPSGMSGMESAGFSGQSFGGSTGFSGSLDLPGNMVADVRFSTWQICGLVCCSLILLTGGIVAFDLVRTIGTSQGTALSNPLLNALAETFGWR